MDNLDEMLQKARRVNWIPWIIFFIFLVILIAAPYLRNSPSEFSKPNSHTEMVLDYMGYSADTRQFDGQYEIDEECLNGMVAKLPTGPQNTEETRNAILDMFRQQYSNMILKEGVMHCGKTLVQEFRMRGDVNEQGEFIGGALWHEDIYDPGDACIVNVKFKLDNDKLYFYFAPLGESFDDPIVFQKK